MNSPHVDATKQWYSNNAAKYSSWVDDYRSTDQLSAFSLLLPPQAKVLDAGCGTGRDAQFLHQSGFGVVGVDFAPGMIELASSRYPDIQFVEADIRDLPFEDQVFDGIWCHAVLINMETSVDVEKALREFHRVLKPGGVMHLLVKRRTSDGSKLYVAEDPGISGHRLVQYFDQEEIEKMVTGLGFSVEISEEYEEDDRNPRGRAGVVWLHFMAKKAPIATS